MFAITLESGKISVTDRVSANVSQPPKHVEATASKNVGSKFSEAYGMGKNGVHF